MYWLVCLPILETEERTWTLLQNKTTYESDYSINFKFAIPELRVGTLDTLMVLSDELVKVNALVESVVNKIRRQLFEMASPGRDDDFQEVGNSNNGISLWSLPPTPGTAPRAGTMYRPQIFDLDLFASPELHRGNLQGVQP